VDPSRAARAPVRAGSRGEAGASLKEGGSTRGRNSKRAKRALYQNRGVYAGGRFSRTTRPPGATSVSGHVELPRGYMHEVNYGVGNGTLDCFRTSSTHGVQASRRTPRRLTENGKLGEYRSRTVAQWTRALCPSRARSLQQESEYCTGARSRGPRFRRRRALVLACTGAPLGVRRVFGTTTVGGTYARAPESGRDDEQFRNRWNRAHEAQPALLAAVAVLKRAGSRIVFVFYLF